MQKIEYLCKIRNQSPKQQHKKYFFRKDLQLSPHLKFPKPVNDIVMVLHDDRRYLHFSLSIA